MDDNNVVLFPGVNHIEGEELGPQVSVEKMFEAALETGLENVVISGTTHSGAIYFASTSGDPKEILWELERAKSSLMLTYFASTQSEIEYDER